MDLTEAAWTGAARGGVDARDAFDAAAIDAVTPADLRARGSQKWTQFPDALGAFVAETDFGMAPAVARAMTGAIRDGITGYLSAAMKRDVKAATAEWCADRYDWVVPEERVQPIADVLSGLALTIQHFSTPGSAVIVPTPAYMPFLRLPQGLGREVIEVPCAFDAAGRAVLDLDALAAAFEAGGNLVLLCNPWNPVGRVLDRGELVALSEVVERHGGRVFADEIHAPVIFGDRRHVPYAAVSEAAAGHTITATSTSKAFNLPGLKCAQLILSNDADAALFDAVGPWAAPGAGTLGVIANIAAYREGGPWLDGMLEYLDGTQQALSALLAEHLPEVRMTPVEGTYIAWLDARALGLTEPAADFFLREAGVALTDGAACGLAGEQHVRLVFATPRPIVEQAVLQMAAAVRRRAVAHH